LGEDNERVKDEEGNEIQISHDDDNNILDDDGNPTMDTETGEVLKATIFTPDPPVVEPPPDPPVVEPPPEDIATLKEKLDEANRAANGIKDDLREERERRRTLESSAPAKPAMTPEEQEEYLNDYPTRKELLAFSDKLEKKISQSTRPLMESTSIANAKKNHEDFDKVSAWADEVLKAQPLLQAAVNLAADPGEARYILGKTHPEYIKYITTKGSADTLKKITNPKIVTSAKVSGSSKDDLSNIDMAAAEKLQRDNPDAFSKLPESVRERIMGGI